MATDRNALKAGTFILIAAALVAGVLVAIKGTAALTGSSARHVAAFDLGEDVGGLAAGNEVRVGGLRLGAVKSVRLDEPQGDDESAPRVLVEFSLPERIALRDGATVTVQSTVTGQAWLNVESLGEGDPIPAEQAIDGRPGGLAALLKSVGDLGSAGTDVRAIIADARARTLPKVEAAITSAGAAADALRGSAERVRERVDPLIDRYAGVADGATATVDVVREMFAENREPVRDAVASARSVASRVDDALPDLIADARAIAADAKVGVGRAKDALADIRTASEDLKNFTGDVKPSAPDARGLLADARAATQAARSLLVSNRGRIDDIVQNVQDASEQLDKASGEIRRSPWRLLYRPDKNEAGNLDLFDAARQFADGANDLSDASVALRDALADPQADQQRLQRMMAELQTSFDRFETVQAGLFERIRR